MVVKVMDDDGIGKPIGCIRLALASAYHCCIDASRGRRRKHITYTIVPPICVYLANVTNYINASRIVVFGRLNRAHGSAEHFNTLTARRK